MDYIFPERVLWGSATSAFQIEGGCENHDFYDWYLQGKIRDNSNPAEAVHFWKYYKDDIALMKKMRHDTVRIGLEWARIEPEKGVFDNDAIAHYRAILTEMKKAGIRPMVTIHHFSNPMWLVREGGWTTGKVVPLFARFTEKVVRSMGDLVYSWITINEPSVYAVEGFLFGHFPPGRKNLYTAMKVMNIMADAHVAAYHAIKEIYAQKQWKDPRTGVAKHLRTFDPFNEKNPLDRLAAGLMDKIFNNHFLERVCKKERTLDIFGINYYSGDLVKFPMEMLSRPHLPKNKLGWDLYPEGFYRVLKRYWDLYHLPIYITENGTCDDNDEIRPRYLLEHVRAMHRAASEGAKIAGYYHWSTMDNFELVDGIMYPFGLVKVDHGHPSRKRTMKRSGVLFGEIAAANGITETIARKYVPDWKP